MDEETKLSVENIESDSSCNLTDVFEVCEKLFSQCVTIALETWIKAVAIIVNFK